MRARGYSLIEFAITLAIAGILTTAAVGVFSIVNSATLRLRTLSAVDIKLQRLTNALVADAQEVGGGAVRPWHAVHIVPGSVASLGSDSALLLTTDADSPSCVVKGFALAGGSLRLDKKPGDPCCLDTPAPGTDEPDDFAHRVALVTRSGKASLVALGAKNTAACTIAGKELIDLHHGLCDDGGSGTSCWGGAQLTVANAKWVFVDHPTHELKAWLLYGSGNAFGVPPASLCAGCGPPGVSGVVVDERTLAADVYDLQFAPGYDADKNGALKTTVNGASDEWLGNGSGEVAGVGAWIGDDPDEGGFVREDLRALQIGVTVALPVRVSSPGLRIFDGDERGGGLLRARSAVARSTLRSAAVFQ